MELSSLLNKAKNSNKSVNIDLKAMSEIISLSIRGKLNRSEEHEDQNAVAITPANLTSNLKKITLGDAADGGHPPLDAANNLERDAQEQSDSEELD